MNSVVKEYMKQHKVLVQYVYDDFGYRYGAVVAIGKGQLGWSMVHHTDDSHWKEVKPWQLPAIQKMELEYSKEEFPAAVLHSNVFKRWLNTGGIVKVPFFQRDRALYEAINKALQGRVIIEGQIIEGDIPMAELSGDVPVDRQAVDALFQMYDRSRRANWDI